MNKRFKTLFAILILALWGAISSAYAAETKNTKPRTQAVQGPFSSPVSLHSLIMSKGDNEVKSRISNVCLSAIQKTIKSGKTFFSKLMVRESRTVSKFPRDDVQDGGFYHWTNSSEMVEIAKSKRFTNIFKYLRSKCDTNYVSCLGGWYMYVAADQDSSREFGSILLKITLPQNALIFLSRADFLPDNVGTNELNAAIEEELIAKEPDLAFCQREMYWRDLGVPSILEALAAEASGISAISYYGVNNRVGEGREGSQWLQLVGPWVIQKMERVQ